MKWLSSMTARNGFSSKQWCPIAVYLDIILFILISQPTNKIFLGCKCEKYLMRLMNISISNVNGSRTKETPMPVPLQIANFVNTIFAYQDVVSRIGRCMEKLYIPLKKFVPQLNLKLLGDKSIVFVLFLGGIAQFKRSCWFTKQGNTCYQNAIFRYCLWAIHLQILFCINLLDLRKGYWALQLAQSMRKIFSMLISVIDLT